MPGVAVGDFVSQVASNGVGGLVGAADVVVGVVLGILQARRVAVAPASLARDHFVLVAA